MSYQIVMAMPLAEIVGRNSERTKIGFHLKKSLWLHSEVSMNALTEYLQLLKLPPVPKKDWNAEAAANRAALYNMMPQPVQNALTSAQGYLSQIPNLGIEDAINQRYNTSHDYFMNQMPIENEQNRAALREFLMRMGGR